MAIGKDTEYSTVFTDTEFRIWLGFYQAVSWVVREVCEGRDLLGERFWWGGIILRYEKEKTEWIQGWSTQALKTDCVPIQLSDSRQETNSLCLIVLTCRMENTLPVPSEVLVRILWFKPPKLGFPTLVITGGKLDQVSHWTWSPTGGNGNIYIIIFFKTLAAKIEKNRWARLR